MFRFSFLFLLPLCGYASAAGPVVAKVGDSDVTAADLRPYFAGLDAARADALRNEPARLAEAVRTLLLQRLLSREAEAQKWAERPEVAEQLQRQRATLIAESYLRAMAAPPEGFPSEAELREAYESAGDSLQVQRRFHLAQIFLADADKAEAELATVRNKLAGPGADFAAIARAHSEEAASAGKGGDLGWLPENLIQPAILKAIDGLKTGGVSEPIKLSEGWHIVTVLGREEPRRLSFDEVKPRLAERLREQHIQSASQAYLAKLLKQNPVSINEIELPGVLAAP